MSEKENRTSADIPVLEQGVTNISAVADEAHTLMREFKSAVAQYGNVFGDYSTHSGGYRGANGGDFAKIWKKDVVPAQEYAQDILDQLNTAVGDVGTQAKGATRKLSDADNDATSGA